MIPFDFFPDFSGSVLHLIRSRAPGRDHDGFTSDGLSWSGHPSGSPGSPDLMTGPYVSLYACLVAKRIRDFGHTNQELHIVDAETGGTRLCIPL